MSQQSQIMPATAMPVQERQSFPDGANSPMTAGIASQNQQVARQMALIGKSGGSKRRRHIRRNMSGGAVDVLVPSVPAGAVNGGQVSQQYADLTKLATAGANNAAFDNSKATPAEVAVIAAKQQAAYSGGSNVGDLCSSCKKKINKTRRKKSTKRLNKGKKGRKSRKQRR
jgi:hypothetical protein